MAWLALFLLFSSIRKRYERENWEAIKRHTALPRISFEDTGTDFAGFPFLSTLSTLEEVDLDFFSDVLTVLAIVRVGEELQNLERIFEKKRDRKPEFRAGSGDLIAKKAK